MRLVYIAAVALAGTAVHSASDFSLVLGGPGLDRGVSLTSTHDGGFAIVGVTGSFGAGDEDVYLVRIDSLGEVLWARTFGGSGADNGWSVKEVNGGLVIAGYTNSYGNGDFDCYLISTDAEGELEWSQTYGGTGSDRCWGFEPTQDGGFLLVGETTSRGNGAEDCYLVRVDATGEELWSRTFGGAESDRCFSVAQASGGGYLMAGQTFSEGAGDRDAYLVFADESGSQQWTKTLGGTKSDVAHHVIRTADDGFLVTGYTTSIAEMEDDPYITKIDFSGRIAWSRVLPLAGTNHTLTGAQSTDGGFFLGGFTESRASGTTAALLVKTDALGNLEWSRDLFRTSAGRSFGYTVTTDHGGNPVLTGQTTVGSNGSFDLFVVRSKQ